MRGLSLASSLRRALESIRGQGSSVEGRRVLTLGSLLDLESVEDAGLFKSRLYEYSSRLLIPRLISRDMPDGMNLAAIDSSSRLVETVSRMLVITVVSVSSWSPLEVYDYPEVYRYPVRPGGLKPFIAVVPGGVFDFPLTGLNPNGVEYGSGYDIYQVMDEWRVFMENWMLEDLIPRLASISGRGVRLIVLVDGPLTLVPGVLANSHGFRVEADAWSRLLMDRVKALRLLEDNGIPVIGVVKRVEKSRILSSTPVLSDRVRECVGGDMAGDRAILYMLQSSGCVKWSPGRLLTTPRIVVEPSVGGAPDKIVEYILIPPGRWQASPHKSRVYRIEYTMGSLELLRSWRLEPHHVIALDSIYRGSLEPVTLKYSDRRAKMISRALRGVVARWLSINRIPVSYGSEVALRR